MYSENEIAREVVNICFQMHKKFGPGLFESVYEQLIAYEMDKAGISFLRQVAIPLVHEKIRLDVGFRADFIVDNKLIIELKSIEGLAPIHYRQVQTYLKLTNLRLGLLINFNVPLIKAGIHRIVHNL